MGYSEEYLEEEDAAGITKERATLVGREENGILLHGTTAWRENTSC